MLKKSQKKKHPKYKGAQLRKPDMHKKVCAKMAEKIMKKPIQHNSSVQQSTMMIANIE